MTLAPTYEALSVKPAENLYVGKKKLLSSWALVKSVRMIVTIVEA